MTFFSSMHYAVSVHGGYRKVDVILLFEHLKDAMKEAKSDLWNSREVTVYSMGNSTFTAKPIFVTSTKKRLKAVKEQG